MEKFQVVYRLGDWWILGQTKDAPSIKVRDFMVLIQNQADLLELIEEKGAE